MVLQNHIYKADIASDYTVTFGPFSTVAAPDAKFSSGACYYEVECVKVRGIVQMGWMTEGFTTSTSYSGNGVGDDAHSWGADGVRQCKWPMTTEFGSEWSNGDVIGFAADLDAKTLSISVNGSFAEPNGLLFSEIKADWLAPALTGDNGQFRVNFGDRPFAHSPPDESYVSVHSLLNTTAKTGSPSSPAAPQCENGVCPV